MEDNADRMTEFQVDKYFDAIKQVGTANSTGLFGGLVALYYFKDQPAAVLAAMKAATGLYLFGLFIFAAAYSAFFKFIGRHHRQVISPTEDLFEADGSFRVARWATIASAVMWALGSLLAPTFSTRFIKDSASRDECVDRRPRREL